MTKDKNILVKNIYYMLSYTFKSLKLETYEKVDKEEFNDIHNLLAAILVLGIDYQLKHGLYREYIGHQEKLSTLRGKINLAETIKTRIAQERVITCEFDELSENNLLNQIVKTTALLLLASDKVERKYRGALRRQMQYFAAVDIIKPSLIKWGNIRLQRNNQTYAMLINFCKLILDGMLLTTEKGDYKLASFLNDEAMHRLYENFLRAYYQKHYPELHPNKVRKIGWDIDEDGNWDLLPDMYTDIHLAKDNDVLIIDAKYYSHNTQYNFGKHSIHSGNLYQIFAYVKNEHYALEKKGIPHKVAGMLLYAKTEDDFKLKRQDYNIHGSRISVDALDLNQNFSGIAAKLDGIVQGYYSEIVKH